MVINSKHDDIALDFKHLIPCCARITSLGPPDFVNSQIPSMPSCAHPTLLPETSPPCQTSRLLVPVLGEGVRHNEGETGSGLGINLRLVSICPQSKEVDGGED